MSLIRVLFHEPAAGAWNMAVDEALLETAAESGQATLRLYGWEEATLSLGYFQSLADRAGHLASRDCPVVRRSSGGGAIVHDRELTYSIAIPGPAGAMKGAGELVEIAHQTLIAALAEFGVSAVQFRDSRSCTNNGLQHAAEPFLCFLRRSYSDILCNDHKIVGSAQRRRRGAVLQHGSILLERSASASELPGVKDLADRELGFAELAERWTPRLAAALGFHNVMAELTTEETNRVQMLAESRFADDRHLARR